MSNREIGRRCGLNHETVGVIRKELHGENRQCAINEPVEPNEPPQECVTLRSPSEVVAQFFVDFPQLQTLSNREIGRRCGLSPSTVGSLRKEVLKESGVQIGHEAINEPVEPDDNNANVRKFRTNADKRRTEHVYA